MEAIGSSRLSALEEFDRFMQEGRCLKIDDDVFDWWHKHKDIYPNLHKIAIRYLIVPATSAESERVFSTAGYILSLKRAKLSGIHANMLIFLNKNMKN